MRDNPGRQGGSREMGTACTPRNGGVTLVLPGQKLIAQRTGHQIRSGHQRDRVARLPSGPGPRATNTASARMLAMKLVTAP